MPVTTGYSTDPEKTYNEKTSPINATPGFTSQDLRASAGAHSSPNGSISSYSRTNSVDSLDDCQSSSSGASGHSRQVSNDSTTGINEYNIPTRSIKQPNKPQHNALQFVKIGSCPLYKQAAEQMKKAEEVKKMKTVAKHDEEDWQHNLDNWKSKRRLSCQKSQDRADELRRLEEEELNYQDKGRRKSKTFSEMVEQRSKRGRNFGYFSDEWDDTDSGQKGGSWDGSDSPRHDLSIDSTGSDPVFRDDESSDTSSVDRNHPESNDSKTKENDIGEKNGNGDVGQETKSPVNGCENGSEANLFEKAIQSYVQFAESQKKTMNSHEKKAVNGGLSSHKPRKFVDDEKIISKPIPEENGSSEEKTNRAASAFCGDRTGGTEMAIVLTLKSGNEHRDFGFTTKGKGRGLVFVETVAFRGPAELAGLRPDDEVLAINGESVSNRSHSAIVFAIKQAVYTGRLELGIYRYNNANQIPKQGISSVSNKKPSRIEEKKAVFTRDNSNDKESSPDKRILREKSPKVDIVKRRSLFESPPKELGEIQQQRRSLDASTALKSKILSFENLENIDKTTKPSDGKRLAQKKLLPTEKQNGTERKSDFMKRLTSFENLESVGNNNYDTFRSSPERKQSLKDKIGAFEKPEVFERSRSCDFLNSDHRVDRALSSPLSNDGNLNDDSRIQSPETASENSFDWDSVDNDNYPEDPVGPPRIIDVVTKEESPEPVAKTSRSDQKLKEMSEKPAPEDKKVDEVMQKSVLPPAEAAEDVQLKRVESTKRIKKELHRLRSDFLGIDPTSNNANDHLGLEPSTFLTEEKSAPLKLEEDLADSGVSDENHDYVNWENGVIPMDVPKQLEEAFYSDIDSKTNEDDEIARKEKEIIEDLEREEQMKTSLKYNGVYKEDDSRAKQEESTNSELERSLREDEKRRQEEERKLREREEQLRQQEEVLRLEKEKLRREQEELIRQREEYQRQIQEHQFMHPPFLPPVAGSKTGSLPQRSFSDDRLHFVEYREKIPPVENHPRMPKKEVKSNVSQVPVSSPESKATEEPFSKVIRIPPEVQLSFPDEDAHPQRKLPENAPPSGAPKPSSHLPMRPKPKLSNDNNEKVPVRRKPDAGSKNSLSYNQHWLIQEAEMRRISEQQERLRQARSPTREKPNEGKQFPDRTKPPVANPPTYSQRPQNNYYGKPTNYASHPQGQQKRPPVLQHEPYSSRLSPDFVEVQTTNPLLPLKNSVQNPIGSLANGDPHMLSVSGKKKCSHCGDELGKGAAMIIESLHLFYHIHCFKCCVCHVQLGNGLSGADVRVRNQKLHCHNCYSNDEAGLKFSKV